jgi:hypothetical protein
MTAEADLTDAINDPPSSPVQRAMDKLVAYASLSNQLAAQVAAAEAPTGGQAEAGMLQQQPNPTPAAPLDRTGERDSAERDAEDRPGTAGLAPFQAPPARGTGHHRAPRTGNLATGPAARFESLDGLYQRIAATAAGGGPDEQANKASLETARNTALILQALEAQNRLLENGKAQQQQPILWQ